MNRTKKVVLLIALLVAGLWVKSSMAEFNETASPDGNFSQSVLGVSQRSTSTVSNPWGLDETRKLRVTNSGDLKTWPADFDLRVSSKITHASSTDTAIVNFEYSGSTFSVHNSTHRLPNANVFAIAYTSEPARIRVRLDPNSFNGKRFEAWDSRGSTEAALGALEIMNVVYFSSMSMPSTYEFTVTTGARLRFSGGDAYVEKLNTHRPR